VSFSCVGFFRRNFAPGSPRNDDRHLGRPTTASPLFVAAVSSASSHRQQFRSGNRLVNPDFAGKSRWFWSASYETLRVTLVSNIEHILAFAAVSFPLGHSEPSLASTSLRRSDGARRCTTEKIPDRKHDCPGCTQSGPGTPADISWFGIGSRKRDCRPTREADYAFS